MRIDIPVAFAEKPQEKSGSICLPEPFPNCSFKIETEGKGRILSVKLSSPSGTTYTSNDEIVKNKGVYTVFTPTAEQGTWICEVTGYNLGKVRVEAGEEKDYIRIDKFTFNKMKSEISWQISYAMGDIHFVLSAETDSGNVVVKEFSSKAAVGTISLDKRSIPDDSNTLILTTTDIMNVPDIAKQKT